MSDASAATTPAPQTPAPPTPVPRLALAFILFTVTLDAIGIGLIFPVMPDLL